jgi:hypothetical protein
MPSSPGRKLKANEDANDTATGGVSGPVLLFGGEADRDRLLPGGILTSVKHSIS